MNDQFDFYKSIIIQTLPQVSNVWRPKISGAKDNVVFAQTYCRSPGYVFKFQPKDVVIRNSSVAYVLRNAGIPAPVITVQEYDNQWFEMYPIIHGQTLHEYVATKTNYTDIRHIYTELLKLVKKMSDINFSDIDFGNIKYAYQTAYNDTVQTNGKTLGKMTEIAVRMMNIGPASDYGLYHHGLTPKNVIISDNGKISGILDIDEVGICNKNYVLGVLCAKAQLIGLDIKSLCDEYEFISGQPLNRTRIERIVHIQNFGRNLLYKTKINDR